MQKHINIENSNISVLQQGGFKDEIMYIVKVLKESEIIKQFGCK